MKERAENPSEPDSALENSGKNSSAEPEKSVPANASAGDADAPAAKSDAPAASDEASPNDATNSAPSPRAVALKTGAWFFVLTTVVVGLISLNYFRQLSIDFAGEGAIYAFCTMFGHFAMFSAVAWLVLCLPWAAAFPRKNVAAPLCIAAGAAGTALVALDTFVFGLYRYHVYNGFVLDLLFGGDAGGIFTFTAGQLALMVFGVLAIVAVSVALWFAARFVARHTRVRSIAATGTVLLVLLVASHLMHAYYSANGSRSVYQIAEVYPGHYPLTMNRFLIRHGFVDAATVREKVKLNAGSALAYPRSPLVPAAAPTKNILIIFVDSWNVNSCVPEVMPNVCKFAEGAQVFTDHYSGDHGTRTGVISFFHGIPGLYFNAIRDGGVSSALIDLAVAEKYEMNIGATASLANPPFLRTVFANVPENAVRYNFSEAGSTAAGDAALADAWLEFTKNYTAVPAAERRPFFGFLFFDELHSMNFPEGAEKKFPTDWENPKYEQLGKDSDPEPFFNLYKNDAYWLDAQLKRVLDDLRERGLLENTIVVITGDHGQEFNENRNNLWGHGSAFSEFQLKVPFILFDADLPPKTFSHWTTHYDAAVTLIQNYLHCANAPSDYSVGKNLFDTSPRDWILVGHPEQFAVIEKDRVTHVKFDRSYEIYDRDYNYLPDAKLNAEVFKAALDQAREFYKK